MTYDVQINNEIYRGITYAELSLLPIMEDTFVRRSGSEWIRASECVELTHVIYRTMSTSHSIATNSDIESQQLYSDHDDYDESDESYEYDVEDEYGYESQIADWPDAGRREYYEDTVPEERIFIPTAQYFKCKQKRKAAIIGVLTLGLAGLALIGVGNTWRSNIFEGTSFSSNAGIAFVLKCISFFILTALTAIPYFIYSVFALIYYSIRLSSLKR